ncbi:MAG: acyl-[acyl-carrier-protein] thioesterase [Lachnospiraceae bacterium]|nr:acyl-[acyl-carrier-protein] thioesterase [Lachnospiraceae bacterium]
MYHFEQRVRYSEVDEQRLLPLSGIIDYFQDCSTFQSEDLGVGLDYLTARGMFWVINSWQLEILRRPALGEVVSVWTRPYELKGFLGFRNFFLKDEAGEYLAKANSIWSLIRTDSFRPVQIPEEVMGAYELGEKLPMEYAPRKIRPEGETAQAEPLTVSRWHLDVNHHVNNGRYIQICQSLLPAGFEAKKLRAEYRAQAFLGDVLHPVIYTESTDPEKYAVALNDAEGNAYVVLEVER